MFGGAALQKLWILGWVIVMIILTYFYEDDVRRLLLDDGWVPAVESGYYHDEIFCKQQMSAYITVTSNDIKLTSIGILAYDFFA